VDKSKDSDHCGACNNNCPLHAHCENGSCVCPTGESECGGVCRELDKDPENCGACGAACSSETIRCVASKCREVEAIASGQARPYGLALDATHVYWTNQGNGTVMKAPLAGGTAVELTAGLDTPIGIAVDATHAYVAAQGSVVELPLAGGVATTLASGAFDAWGVAVDATHVYWTTSTSVARTTKQPGGSVELIATASIGEGFIAVDGSGVYFTAEGDDAVMKAPLAGGSTVILASDQYDPRGIALDASNVYWTNYAYNGWINNDLGSVVSVPKAGGTPDVIASGLSYPTGIAVLGSVYWAMQNRIMADPDGMLVASAYDPKQVAANASHVYWTNAGALFGADGSVVRTIR
jgi:hypothetical protein